MGTTEQDPAASVRQGTARVAIIGMGYVGLPLAIEFGRRFDTLGFDINPHRLADLARGEDRTLEATPEELRAATRLRFSADPADLAGYDFYIVTVPTPVDAARQPDLGPLVAATHTVGSALRRGAIVIYESTVYPGCTEEICVPVLEARSGLTFNRDFFCGYSPERINPGDRQHRLTTILKVTSGSTPEAAAAVDALYAAVIKAGTHSAPSIRVAEAAKVIENAQRDINIAFVNELAMIFHALGIDTGDVLAAAGTKWNFLPFRPGLVGGHCIGVDPYYLTHKAQMVGHNPEIILAGRRLNDGMGRYAASRLIKLLIRRGHTVKHSRVLVLGLTFKENCPDIRNTKVIDLVRELQEFGCRIDVHDPWADPADVRHEYGLDLVPRPTEGQEPYDAIVLAVAHEQFRDFQLERFRHEHSVVFDLKDFFDREQVDDRL
jgi:UDP-N-acetyl-D-galactosamine dehydrogenase